MRSPIAELGAVCDNVLAKKCIKLELRSNLHLQVCETEMGNKGKQWFPLNNGMIMGNNVIIGTYTLSYVIMKSLLHDFPFVIIV